MATFKRLTLWNGEVVIVNLDQVWTMWRMPVTVSVIGQSSERPERTRLRFGGAGSDGPNYVDVMETPTQVAGLEEA
jgi:hypothetical protein